MTVELDVFSGRPNPSWALTGAQGDELLRLLRDVRGLRERTPPAAPGLGYRGLILKVSAGASIEQWQVGNGAAEIGGRVFPDEGRHIERFVIATMPPDLRAQFAAVLPPM